MPGVVLYRWVASTAGAARLIPIADVDNILVYQSLELIQVLRPVQLFDSGLRYLANLPILAFPLTTGLGLLPLPGLVRFLNCKLDGMRVAAEEAERHFHSGRCIAVLTAFFALSLAVCHVSS